MTAAIACLEPLSGSDVVEHTVSTASDMLRDERFADLGDREKRLVIALLSFCHRIDHASQKRVAIRSESTRLHAGRRYSEGALRKVYYDKWRHSGGDWFSLVNRARVRATDNSGLAPETVEWWHQLCYTVGGDRKHRAAWRELRRTWIRGEAIPGVAEEAHGGRPDLLPSGLSYRNLMQKRYRPSKRADVVSGIGIKAAAKHLPTVLTTRVGLRPGSRYVFDDMWHNVKVVVPGQIGARRLLQFHGEELLSGCQFARGYRPEILNDQTGKFERLKEREMLFLLAHALCGVGYCPSGCVLMLERGTANISEQKAALISDFSRGVVTVQRGAVSDGALAPGLYGGQSGGNPRFKSALESLGGYIQNESTNRLALPAQTGTNSRLDKPEELYGREKHLTHLQKAALALPVELRELLRLGAGPLWQTIQYLDAVQEDVNCRDDHEIEGWEECGFVTTEYRLSEHEDFRPATALLEMPEELRNGISALLQHNPRLQRARKLSPREVFDAFRPSFERLPAHALPILIGMEYAEERRVGNDGDFHFGAEDLGPQEHHYEGVIVGAHGERCRLPSGETYATFVSAIDPRRMHLCDAKGRYVGYVERIVLASRADPHAFARAAGRKARATRELLAPVLAAAQPIIRRQATDAAFNAAILQQSSAEAAAIATTPTRARKRDAREILLGREAQEDSEG